MLDGVGVLDHELEHEAAHLAALSALSGIVVDERHVLCSLYEAIEIVGIEAVALVTSREMVLFAEEIRNERTAVFRLRQVAFVHTEHEHILEVEIARFEHSHQLNAHCGFSVERQGMGINDLEKKTRERERLHTQYSRLLQLQQAIHNLESIEN